MTKRENSSQITVHFYGFYRKSVNCHEKLFFRLTLKCHGKFAGMARNPTEKVVGSQFVDFILKKFAEMFQRIRDIFDEGKKNRREVGSR